MIDVVLLGGPGANQIVEAARDQKIIEFIDSKMALDARLVDAAGQDAPISAYREVTLYQIEELRVHTAQHRIFVAWPLSSSRESQLIQHNQEMLQEILGKKADIDALQDRLVNSYNAYHAINEKHKTLTVEHGKLKRKWGLVLESLASLPFVVGIAAFFYFTS